MFSVHNWLFLVVKNQDTKTTVYKFVMETNEQRTTRFIVEELL